MGAVYMYYNLNEGRFKHIHESYVEEFAEFTTSFWYQAMGFPSLSRRILIQTNQKEYVEDD